MDILKFKRDQYDANNNNNKTIIISYDGKHIFLKSQPQCNMLRKDHMYYNIMLLQGFKDLICTLGFGFTEE